MYSLRKNCEAHRFYDFFYMLHSIEQYIKIVSTMSVVNLPEHIYAHYREKIAIMNEMPEYISINKLDLTIEEKMEVISVDFRWRVNDILDKDIFFWDELKAHILDSNGNVLPFDSGLFLILKQYANKFCAFNDETHLAARKHKEIIMNGQYSEGIKRLTDADMHESRVTFELKEPYIIANFGQALYNAPLICRFHAIFNEDMRVFDCEIHASEVLLNPDGTFQYNALVDVGDFDIDNSNNIETKEIHIPFYDVQVEEGTWDESW